MSIDLRKLSVQKTLTNIHLSPKAGDWMTDKGQQEISALSLQGKCRQHNLKEVN